MRTLQRYARPSVAERYEIVIDFSKAPAGTKRIELLNGSNKNNRDYENTGKIMAFDLLDGPVTKTRANFEDPAVSEADPTWDRDYNGFKLVNSEIMTLPKTGPVNWVDFVQLNGAQFIAEYGPGHPIASAQMGAVVGRVRCQISALKFSELPEAIVDGDAAFLPIGTEMHSILGFDPSCRVAAQFKGINRVYLAHHDVDGSSTAVPCAKAP